MIDNPLYIPLCLVSFFFVLSALFNAFMFKHNIKLMRELSNMCREAALENLIKNLSKDKKEESRKRIEKT